MADPMAVDAVTEEAPVAVPVEIWSLRAGQALSVKVGHGATIRVRAVHLAEAAALEALLTRQVGLHAWVVPEQPRRRARTNSSPPIPNSSHPRALPCVSPIVSFVSSCEPPMDGFVS